MPRKENLKNIAKRKEQIVKAAITAFARTGLKGTSMNDIVRESGMSKGAIYWYFKSKDELISELINTFFNPDEINTLERLLSTGTVRERINRLVNYTIDEMTKMRRFRPVIQELYVIFYRDQKIKKMAKKSFQASAALLQGIFQDGIKNNEIRSVDPYQIAVTIFEIIEGAALFWFLGIMDVDFEKQLRDGVNLIIDGIETRK